MLTVGAVVEFKHGWDSVWPVQSYRLACSG